MYSCKKFLYVRFNILQVIGVSGVYVHFSYVQVLYTSACFLDVIITVLWGKEN